MLKLPSGFEPSKFQQSFDAILVDLNNDSHVLRHKDEIFAVWYASPFIQRLCVSQPHYLKQLLDNSELKENYDLEDYQRLLSEEFLNSDSVEAIQKALRKIRASAYARIAWRDLQEYADVQQTLNELSFFADVCAQGALQWCFEWLQSRPHSNDFVKKLQQNIVIFALGKLGGGELNFSSDIDIVFAYSDDLDDNDIQQAGKAAEFYLKVVQLFIKVLSEQTQDGFVFRVDTRLRPFGNSGTLIPSFSSVDQYFQSHGRDWERYAWLKARVIAGDQLNGEQFLQEVTPFVYRRYLDYGAVESLREMKDLIDVKASQESAKENLKIGFGGIREIEFIAQMFQLIYGGKDSSLRLRSTLRALQQLEAKGLITPAWNADLTKAYLFLRKAENCLQFREDQQVHSLPVEEQQQIHFVYLMGVSSWQEFYGEYQRHTFKVNEIYQSLLKANGEVEDEGLELHGLKNVWPQLDEKEYCLEILGRHFNANAEPIYEQLNNFKKSSLVKQLVPVAGSRLDSFVPIFLQQTMQVEDPFQVFKRFLNILKKITQRSTYISLLIENKDKLAKIFKLIDSSPWVSQYLATHPVLLDELLRMDDEYKPPGVVEMQQQLMASLVDSDSDLEKYMEGLREFKHAQAIQIAAADVVENYPIMKVSDHLSWLAETCINSAVQYAYRELVQKHGEPQCISDNLESKVYIPEVLIVEYGKLGGLELGYGSDLDLVFLHNSMGEVCEAAGDKKIHNDIFFTRLVQRTIHILSTVTASGKVFDTDLRLRPHGDSGPIICSVHAYENYLINDAWLWEHQALVRARAVTSSKELNREFVRIRQKVLCRTRKVDDVQASIIEMRNKMLAARKSISPDEFNIKQDAGGVIDIEFIVQFLVLSYSHKQPDICRYTDNVRILEDCSQAGLVQQQTVEELKEIYLSYRKYLHQLSLKMLPETVDISLFVTERDRVQNHWTSLLHSDSG